MATKTIHNPQIETLCSVGDPMIVEWKGGKYSTVFRGMKPDRMVLSEIQSSGKEPTMRIDVPGFMLIDVPVVDGSAMPFEFNAMLNIRFLTEGRVYSFKTMLARVHQKASVLVLESPQTMLCHNLRTSERISMMVAAEVAHNGDAVKMGGAITDISSSGAMLALGSQVGVGSNLSLDFRLPDGTPVSGVHVTVRNLRNEEEKYFAGVSFASSTTAGLQSVKNYYSEHLKYVVDLTHHV